MGIIAPPIYRRLPQLQNYCVMTRLVAIGSPDEQRMPYAVIFVCTMGMPKVKSAKACMLKLVESAG